MRALAEKLLFDMGIDAAAIERLQVYESMLLRWSKVKNLVSAPALEDLWLRHFVDSAQVQRAIPGARIWCDIGSGAGFPGLVTAILLHGKGGAHVHLVESDKRKCAFLRDVSRETGLRTTVHPHRIENVIENLPPIDAVSARALAPMQQLIDWTDELLIRGATGVFLKGKGVQAELTRLTDPSRFAISLRQSLSHPDGAIVLVSRHTDQPEPNRDSIQHEGSGSR